MTTIIPVTTKVKELQRKIQNIARTPVHFNK